MNQDAPQQSGSGTAQAPPAAETKPTATPEAPARASHETTKKVVESVRKNMSTTMFGQILAATEENESKSAAAKPDKKPDETKTKDEKKEAAKTDESKGDESSTQEKAPPKAKRKPRPEVSDIVDAAAKAAAEATRVSIQEANKPTKGDDEKPSRKSSKPPESDEIPEHLKGYEEALAELPKRLPDKYGDRDLVAEVKQAKSKLSAYQRSWEKKNPGVAFDPDDSDHQDFIAENLPDIPEDDLESVKEQIKEDKIAARVRKEFEKEYGGDLNQLKQEKKLREIAPVYQRAVATISGQIATAIGPELAEALKAGKVAEFAEKDPDATAAAADAAQWADAHVETAIKFIGGIERLNPEKKEHAEFVRTLESVDKELSLEGKTPPDLSDGRSFASTDDWKDMSPRERKDYYSVVEVVSNPEVATVIFGAQAANLAKTAYKFQVDRFEKVAAARGYAKKSAEAKEKEETKPVKKVEDSSSPTVTARPPDNGSGNQKPTPTSFNGLPTVLAQRLGLLKK